MLFESVHANPLRLLQQAEQLMARGRRGEAASRYTTLTGNPEFSALAHLRLSLIASADGRHRDAVAHALSAYEARLPDADLMEMLCKRLHTLGEYETAIACASDPTVLKYCTGSTAFALGRLMNAAFQPALALQLLRRAQGQGMDGAAVRYLIASTQLQLGLRDEAEAGLEHVLRMDPTYAQAHWALSRVRTQTLARNHVEQVRAVISRHTGVPADLPMLYYALFKELDDIGETDAAWTALEQGMRSRRRLLDFEPAVEQRLFDALSRTQAEDRPDTPPDGPCPIFIVGLPRSGTTVLERILGAHPQIADAGELHDFTQQLRWSCDLAGGNFIDAELADRAHDLDWAELGQRYLSHTQWRAGGKAFYTDKMPANYLLLGYILQALPHARVLHMTRGPMDTCFSNLKMLFGDAYPYSYDQLEMAAHYRNYRLLMAHWHAQFPGRIHDVSYADLVSEPEATGRDVLAYCDLDWHDGLTAIEERDGTITTASAQQVREPIHARYLDQWKRYQAQLEPMRAKLGIYGR